MIKLRKEFSEVVTTLYEGHYHHGVAALINSLVRSGFKGLINIGYKGHLPPWIKQLERKDDNFFYLTEDIFISFELLFTKLHFGYYKPFFLKETLDKFKEIDKIYYFDPDIIITAPWSFFSCWVDNGVSLCLDNCFSFVHRNHPWRNEWRKLASSENQNYNLIDFYVNSGFIGLSRNHQVILNRWIAYTCKYKESGGNLTLFEKDGFRAFKGDQDLLNAVLTTSPDIAFSVIGQEGMGFSDPAYLMTHAVGDLKPWEKNFVKYILKFGLKPNKFEKNFMRFCSQPINLFSSRVYQAKKINMIIASIIGRFYG